MSDVFGDEDMNDGEDDDLADAGTPEEGTGILDFVFPESSPEAEGEVGADMAGAAPDAADLAAGEGALALGLLGGTQAVAPGAANQDEAPVEGGTEARDDSVVFDVVTGLDGAAPALISGFDTAADDPDLRSDRIFLYDAEGGLIPEADLRSGERMLSVSDMPDGTGAALYLDIELVAVFEDYTADELASDTSWLGNFTEAGALADPSGTDDEAAPAETARAAAPEEDAATAGTGGETEAAAGSAAGPAGAAQDDMDGDTDPADNLFADMAAQDDAADAAQADQPPGAEAVDTAAAQSATTQSATTPTITLEVTEAEGTGDTVSDSLFGGNVIYTVNTVDGDPNANIVDALDATDIDHIRFPAGQGDGLAADEGTGWLNIVDLDYDENGDPMLGEEITTLLDWASDPDGDGGTSDAVQVTLVIPTQHLTLAEYEDFADDIEVFSQLVMEQYGDVIEAFEVGNEYWSSMGEAEYGAKADLAIQALADGMEAAGVATAAQPDIVVQMGTPTGASDFGPGSPGTWIERLEDSNEAIIDELGTEARDDVDGVAEHYYYRQDHATYQDSLNEFNYIEKDYAVWDDAFTKDLDLYITEWNIKSTNYAENGMKSASTLLEQFENMVDLGADSADVWAVMHNTSTDLAGDRDGTVTTDAQDRVTTSIRGAVFDLMSSSLPGTELIETDIAGDDGTIEVNAYQGEDDTVVYIASRSTAVETVEVDLSALVRDYDTASGVKIGIDQSGSDGQHWVSGQGLVEPDYVMLNGQKYYYNEHDVPAQFTDMAVTSSTVTVTLNPYEVMEVSFSGTTPIDEPISLDDNLVGTEGADSLKGFSGDDTLTGLGGDDTLAGSQGEDSIYGGAGDDLINGGQQDDRVWAGSGDDEVIGWSGNDYLKGNQGADTITGDGGDDTLAGSQGDDMLFGGNGDDEMNGGMDDDLISGGAGADTVTGWSGSDTFAFAGGDIDDGDVITDFQPSHDVIELDVPGVTSIADLVFTQRPEGGVLVGVPDYGTILLQGTFSVNDVAQSNNFAFLGAAA